MQKWPLVQNWRHVKVSSCKSYPTCIFDIWHIPIFECCACTHVKFWYVVCFYCRSVSYFVYYKIQYKYLYEEIHSGCVLQSANEEAGKHGLLIPLDLGAKGSCNLGKYINFNKIFSCFLSNDLFLTSYKLIYWNLKSWNA